MPQDDRWVEFENSLPALSQAMPTEVASMADRTVRPMSAIEKALYGSRVAITHPNGTITYNRDNAERGHMDPYTAMAHELTHIGQLNQRGFLGQLAAMLRQESTPYLERPDERAAYDKEQTYWRRTQDINLPAEKK